MEQKKELTGYPSIDKPWLKYFSSEDLNYSYSECSMYDFMMEQTKDYDNLIALEYYGTKISYKDMKNNIDRVASALHEYGVKQGEIVSICLPNIPEMVFVFYAINKIGAVANFLDPRCGEKDLLIALLDAKSKLLFSLDIVIDKFKKIYSQTKLKLMVSVDALNSLSFLLRFIKRNKISKSNQNYYTSIMEYNDFIRKYSQCTKATYLPQYKIDAPSVIAYTGGTTGIPKGVIMTDYAINATVTMSWRAHYNMSFGDRALDIAPPWTYYGLNNCLHTFLCFGVTSILIPQLEADELGELIYKFKPNHVITVPSALNSIITCKKLKSKLCFLKEIIVGADKLDEETEEKFNDFLRNNGCRIVLSKGYGMTEVAAGAAFSKANSNTIANDGIPYIGNIITAFIEQDGEYIECKYGEVGEIAINGPSIMQGYFGRYEELTKEVKKQHLDGTWWVHSGDLGYIDEDGKIHIAGRLKRMFVKNGFKIFAPAVENAIMSCTYVEKAVVVPIQDIDNGCIAKAYLILTKDIHNKKSENDIVNDIKRQLLNVLYDYELPDLFEITDELPLTGMGKVDYKALERLANKK